jgi:hypothetical protein
MFRQLPDGVNDMPESNASVKLDLATKLLAGISVAISVFAAWKAVPVDAEIKRLQAETVRLDLALKQADADLKNIESNRKLTMELYQEVKKVIEKQEKDPREEDAVKVLVESLSDDPFRWKLLNVIAIGAKSSDVKESAAAASKFYEEDAVAKRDISVPATATSTAGKTIGAYNIDFFFCESRRSTSEPLARAALNSKGKNDSGRWRVRLLPESVNQQPGYGITGNQIRYTPPGEKPIADAIAHSFASNGVQFAFHETSYSTPGYVSVFFCQ